MSTPAIRGMLGLQLTLLLLVLRVGANHPHDAFAADDLAVFADPPDAASNFHDDKPFRAGPDRRIDEYSMKNGGAQGHGPLRNSRFGNDFPFRVALQAERRAPVGEDVNPDVRDRNRVLKM